MLTNACSVCCVSCTILSVGSAFGEQKGEEVPQKVGGSMADGY